MCKVDFFCHNFQIRACPLKQKYATAPDGIMSLFTLFPVYKISNGTASESEYHDREDDDEGDGPSFKRFFSWWR